MRNLYKWLTAGSVALILGGASYFLFFRKSKQIPRETLLLAKQLFLKRNAHEAQQLLESMPNKNFEVYQMLIEWDMNKHLTHLTKAASTEEQKLVAKLYHLLAQEAQEKKQVFEQIDAAITKFPNSASLLFLRISGTLIAQNYDQGSLFPPYLQS